MAARGKRRSRLRRIASGGEAAAPAAHGIGPTPETAARLRGDVVLGLVRDGLLSAQDLDAALEIRTVHEAVGRGMFPRMPGEPGAGSSSRQFGPRDFTRQMSARERHLWETRYLPWSGAMAVSVAAGLAGTRWLQLVVDIVVDNATPEEAEARYRLPEGAAIRFLAEGLRKYLTGGPRAVADRRANRFEPDAHKLVD